jgi:hypothetical protein
MKNLRVGIVQRENSIFIKDSRHLEGELRERRPLIVIRGGQQKEWGGKRQITARRDKKKLSLRR